jgi:hypothetical protein
MSTSQDTRENTEAIKELTGKVTDLTIKCEILTERLATIQKLVYGVVGIILVAVVTALIKGVVI